MIALALLPGVLTIYVAFNSGGYFAGATSIAALAVALVLLLRAVAADRPLAGLSPPVAVAAAALMLLAAWQLLSAQWSDSPSRALLDFNRTVLYLLVLLLFGSITRSTAHVRRILWGVAGAATVVCAAGFLTRALPDVFAIAPTAQAERLGYPIGYWNALGLLAALGIVLCIHLTSSEREPLLARVSGAAALPLLSATLLFTFSRGPLAALVVGAVAYALIARPRALLSGLLAAGPPTAVAVLFAYRADLLASKEPTTAAAAAQGHEVALAVLVCGVAAAVLRRLLLALDVRLVNVLLEARAKRRLGFGSAAVAALAAAGLLIGTDIGAQSERFTRSEVRQTGDNRDRLTDPGINRLETWKVALDAFGDSPVKGQGAGTYALRWDLERPIYSDREEAHSLYLETLGELGLVGLLLLAAALLSLLAGVGARARGPDRALYGAVLAAGIMWALQAGIDWEWEIPAVTLWLFALGGSAAAASDRPDGGQPPAAARTRVLMALGCVCLAATPAVVAASQARLAESVRAYEAGDCFTAVERANASVGALGSRPEPFEVIGYCSARLGQGAESEAAMIAAIDRDPRNWEYRYGLALVRAAAGRDPRAASREALELNPREPRAQEAAEAFARAADAREWRLAAGQIRVAIR